MRPAHHLRASAVTGEGESQERSLEGQPGAGCQPAIERTTQTAHPVQLFLYNCAGLHEQAPREFLGAPEGNCHSLLFGKRSQMPLKSCLLEDRAPRKATAIVKSCCDKQISRARKLARLGSRMSTGWAFKALMNGRVWGRLQTPHPSYTGGPASYGREGLHSRTMDPRAWRSLTERSTLCELLSNSMIHVGGAEPCAFGKGQGHQTQM